MNEIKAPNMTFKPEMLNPDHWNFENSTGSYTFAGFIITTTEWISMQNAALTLLNEYTIEAISERTIRFWKSIVNGCVPIGLNITQPDPITNMR